MTEGAPHDAGEEPGGVPLPAAAGSGRTDDERFEAFARELLAAAEVAVAGWVTRCVERRAAEAAVTLDEDALDGARAAGELARVEVCGRLRDLLETDIDQQGTSPLEVLRTAVAYPTAVLRHAGVPPVVRDDFARAEFVDDDYDLTPWSLAEIDSSLHEPGIRWGAAKAHVHLARRRSEGRL